MDLNWTSWVLGGLTAVLVGLAKTGIPGLGVLVVPMMAAIFPARESVGALLPLVCAADLFAVAWYRQHAQWRLLRRVAPWVALGMITGGGVLWRIDSARLKPLLGTLVLLLALLEILRRRLHWNRVAAHPGFTAGSGAAAGFSSTVGNVSGPIMSIYFVSSGLSKQELMGTSAWCFFIMNLCKVPIYGGMGLITSRSLTFNLAVLPLIVLGALLGRWLMPRIPQAVFNSIVLALAALAALHLLL